MYHIAAVEETATKMFGMKIMTLMQTAFQTLKNARSVGKGIEAMAMSEIVKKFVSSDETSTVTYKTDGSIQQGSIQQDTHRI